MISTGPIALAAMLSMLKRTFGVDFLTSRRFSSNLAPSTFESTTQFVVESPRKPTTYSPNVLACPDYFQVAKTFTIAELFEARVHLGHREGCLDDRMKPYLFGSRLGHLIIDLNKTAELLTVALNIAAHIAYRDGIILFVSQTPQHSQLVETTARDCSEFAHTRFWRPGMLTNATMMFGAMTRLPDLLIVLNTLTTVLDEHWSITEAAKMAIPVIGVVDTNCNPNLITYPIPGNDDTPSAIKLYCSLFKSAILKGKREGRIGNADR